MSARISVVVPAYNNAPYLAATLRSVLAQTYDDFEVVVADHSSVDGTAEVLESFRGHAKLRILSPTPSGGGAPANWNRVTGEAEGEWVKLVCGDDLLDARALATQVAMADRHPSAVMVASRRRIVAADGRRLISARGLGRLDGLVGGREAIRATVRAGANVFGEPACILLRREVLAAAGGWADEFPYLLDEATYVNVLRHGDVVAVREPLASFRVSAGQWSVRLAKLQAEQVIGFHRSLRESDPGLVSAVDVLVGNARARRNALGRRMLYRWLALRGGG